MTKFGMKSLVAALALIFAVSTAPDPSFALSKRYCHDYARKVANRKANVGNVLVGTAIGAGTGALVGALVGGRRSVGRGAIIGGVGGTVVGGVHTNEKWRRVYNRTYAECRQW
ncbi:MAG: YMGG-like glycine zipper-containing protein [Aestuariivirga sp.]